MLDRLVGGAVLADADGVMAPHEHRLGLAQGGQPHRGAHVVAEHQERAHHRQHAAVQRHAVGHRPHRVLTDAIEQLAASGVLCGQHLGSHVGAGVAGEVGAAADEGGNGVQRGVQHTVGGHSGGHLRARFERRQPRQVAVDGPGRPQRLQPVAAVAAGLQPGFPLAPLGCAACARCPVGRQHVVVHHELSLGVHAHRPLRGSDLVGIGDGAVGGRRVRRGGHRVADVAADDHHRRAVADQHRLAQRPFEGVGVFRCVAEVVDVPAVGLEAPGGVVAERQVGAAVDGYAVVVVHRDEPAELLVAGQRCGLVADALHQVAVTDDHERAVIGEVGAEARAEAPLGQCHADGVGEALPERPGGHLDAGREAALRVAGCDRPELAEVADVVQRHPVAHEVRDGIGEHRGVPGRQDEAVAVWPFGG